MFSSLDNKELIGYLVYWVLFGMVHSVTARPEFKAIFPLKRRYYRIFYNIISVITLGLVLINVPAITPLLFDILSQAFPKIFLVIPLFLISIYIMSIGLLSWDIPVFLGLASENDDELSKSGIFAFSRHPVYTGIILFFITLVLANFSTASVSWLLGAGGYFVIGTIFEEKNLSIYFDDYQEYRNQVGRFFPWRMRHFQYFRENYQ